MKVNPKRIPRTQADVDRARERGRTEGITGALTIFLFTLRDKFGADDTQLQEFADAFNYVLDSIERGYITEADLRQVVRSEYGTTIHYQEKKTGSRYQHEPAMEDI